MDAKTTSLANADSNLHRHPDFSSKLRIGQVRLDPTVAHMDVGGLQPPRAEIDELVRHAGRPEKDLPRLAFEALVAHREERPPLADDEELIVRMDMPFRPDADLSVV